MGKAWKWDYKMFIERSNKHVVIYPFPGEREEFVEHIRATVEKAIGVSVGADNG